MTKQEKAPVRKLGNIVINHKVEQIVRAIVLSDVCAAYKYLNVNATCGMILQDIEPMGIVEVGTTKGGWAFHPDTNTALIMLGLNPNAVLLRLNSTLVEGAAALAESSGRLVTPFCAVVAVAYECSYSGTYKSVTADYRAYKRDTGAEPKHFKSYKVRESFNNKVGV